MAPNSREYIESFYREFRDSAHSKHLAVAGDFVLRLYDDGKFADLTFFTSHASFNLTREAKYPEWFEKPRLSIDATFGADIAIQLIVPRNSPPVRRTFGESVICPPSLPMEEFDKLFAKFISATKS